MIIKIDKKIEILYDKTSIKLPEKLQEDINKFWKKIEINEPNLWDGEFICVERIEETKDRIILICKKTKYSHYLYDERIGIEDSRHWCSCLWGGILLKTKDGYCVIGESSENTSLPFCMQISGGGSESADRINGKINIHNTIKRELEEELNLKLEDTSEILNYEMKYLEIPKGRRHAYGIIAVGNLNMTKKQMKHYYQNYMEELKKNGEEIEFRDLKFIKISNAIEGINKFNNPKREYIKELLEIEQNNSD